jgi:predicted ATPase
MKVLDSLAVFDWRGLPDVSLKNLGDINIIVGPNNSGKSSLLEALGVLDSTKVEATANSGCPICDSIAQAWNAKPHFRNYPMLLWSYQGTTRDQRRGGDPFRLELAFNSATLSSLTSSVAWDPDVGLGLGEAGAKNFLVDQLPENRREEAAKHLEGSAARSVLLQCAQGGYQAASRHVSLLRVKGVLAASLGAVGERVLHFADDRVRTVKDKTAAVYLAGMQLAGQQVKDLATRLGTIVDPRISDFTTGAFDVRFRGGQSDALASQGSGVRAIVPILADLEKYPSRRIVLIDEPELGLNQTAKTALLTSLRDHVADRQIFIATHDPTFVNPLLLRDVDVSIYVFSQKTDGFEKVDLNESTEDPAVFSGYLSHTHSLRKYHIYVEGSQDVYIFRDMLRKFLAGRGGDWWRTFEQVGIYHLSGCNWVHLASTIPLGPHKCILVLDGNKKAEAANFSYSVLAEKSRPRARQNVLSQFPNVLFCEDLDAVKQCWKKGESCPIYCLPKNDISQYFTKDDGSPVSKKDAVALALSKTDNLPKGLADIFDALL